jgi:hypothetical protein
MHEKYLGDSYDIVKRFWAERLRPVGLLVAHPRFVPLPIRPQFELMAGMPVFNESRKPNQPFGLLLDPHTGIPLPTSSSQAVSASHAPLAFIDSEATRLGPRYLVCFDQSHKREAGLSAARQRAAKRTHLNQRGWFSFYYVSHAPFLFASRSEETLDEVSAILIASGIPAARLETELSNESG